MIALNVSHSCFFTMKTIANIYCLFSMTKQANSDETEREIFLFLLFFLLIHLQWIKENG